VIVLDFELWQASILAKMGALVEELINVCPNSVLPTLKTQIALSGLHGKRKLHDRDGLGTEAWSSCTGAVIRSIVAQFRNLAKDPDARRRCFSKAAQRSAAYGIGGDASYRHRGSVMV
jgi:hypothetical protein